MDMSLKGRRCSSKTAYQDSFSRKYLVVGAIGCQAVDKYNYQFEQKFNLGGRSSRLMVHVDNLIFVADIMFTRLNVNDMYISPIRKLTRNDRTVDRPWNWHVRFSLLPLDSCFEYELIFLRKPCMIGLTNCLRAQDNMIVLIGTLFLSLDLFFLDLLLLRSYGFSVFQKSVWLAAHYDHDHLA